MKTRKCRERLRAPGSDLKLLAEGAGHQSTPCHWDRAGAEDCTQHTASWRSGCIQRLRDLSGGQNRPRVFQPLLLVLPLRLPGDLSGEPGCARGKRTAPHRSGPPRPPHSHFLLLLWRSAPTQHQPTRTLFIPSRERPCPGPKPDLLLLLRDWGGVSLPGECKYPDGILMYFSLPTSLKGNKKLIHSFKKNFWVPAMN